MDLSVVVGDNPKEFACAELDVGCQKEGRALGYSRGGGLVRGIAVDG